MATAAFAPGILYHVIVRGNYRQKTFRDDRDYEAYLERLARPANDFGVTVYAYCLMSNHVHLLLETGTEPLSRFTQRLQQSYTQYFNRKHHKAGHLFQGRYKAIVCEKEDNYLLTLVRYIHLIPIKAKLRRDCGFVLSSKSRAVPFIRALHRGGAAHLDRVELIILP